MIEGTKGIFDIVADGKMVFSKCAEIRFPEEGEVVERLRARR
ncbi:MAG: Rdx family protein [Planctomycetota bacterium]